MSKSKPPQPAQPVLDYWNIFRELPDSYLLLEANDPTYTVLEVNEMHEKLTGVARDMVIGKPFFSVYKNSNYTFLEGGAEAARERFQHILRTGKPQHLDVFSSSLRIASGSPELRYWQPVYLPLKLGNKHARYILVAMKDITERRDLLAQVELARKQDLLNRQASKLLQDRNSELEAIGRTKDEFVALASHQLRTPATAVKQYVGMVLQGYVGEMTELQKEMLERAFESNERQIQIINQILNAARVDTGRLVMTPIELDLVALAQGISDEMRSSLEQRNHTFTATLPKQRVPVMADLGYLRMAIENLLHNASIYTPEGGSIALKLVVTGKRAELSITDNGVGIKKTDVGKLFVKFSRIHNPLSVQAGGSGIGLYLTAEIIRLHGGTVSVTSKIRSGSTFAISLPLTL